LSTTIHLSTKISAEKVVILEKFYLIDIYLLIIIG